MAGSSISSVQFVISCFSPLGGDFGLAGWMSSGFWLASIQGFSPLGGDFGLAGPQTGTASKRNPVSVPLAGILGWREPPIVKPARPATRVSVPLAGILGWRAQTQFAQEGRRRTGFSPLGGDFGLAGE